MLDKNNSLRHLVPDRWWEKAPAIIRVSLKRRQLSLNPETLSEQLDRIRRQGFTVVEIFAPADGGKSYGGLDAKDRYRLDPEVGTMDDFRRLVRLAHSKGLAVITFDNLGYCAIDAPHFLKACDDMREGRNSREAKWFCWGDSKDAPPPVGDGRYYMVQEYWEYSERAQLYYWTKWAGTDEDGNKVRLPQYNWQNVEFHEEAERVVRFWMDTGIDGMIIDAVNWYIGYTWEIGRRRITDVISSYGNAFSQPEGAGGFHEDPVAWITDGGWNCVQDYGSGIPWEKDTEVHRKAIEGGDPRPIEAALRDYHDRVVTAEGVLYAFPPRFDDLRRWYLAVAMMATASDMVAIGCRRSGLPEYDPEISWLFDTKAKHPALHQLSIRRQLPTSADDKCYALLKTSADGSERIMVMFNFQETPRTVEVDLSGVATAGLLDLRNGELHSPRITFAVELPAHGYGFYQVLPT